MTFIVRSGLKRGGVGGGGVVGGEVYKEAPLTSRS